MMKQKRFDFLIKEIPDRYTQENFLKLRQWLVDFQKQIDSINVESSSNVAFNTQTVVTMTKKSIGALSALRAVQQLDDDEITTATNNGTYQDAQVLGVSKTAAGGAGVDVEVVTFGEIKDAAFNSYVINQPVFLGISGALTQTAPVTGFSVTVGFCNAPGSIFVNPTIIVDL